MWKGSHSVPETLCVASTEGVRSEHRKLQLSTQREKERGDQVAHLDPIPPGPR